MKIFAEKTNFDFMGKSKIAITLSTLLILATIYIWFARGDSKYGTDYIGGFEFVIELDQSVDSDATVKLREAFQEGGFSDVVVQSYQIGSGKYAIRLPGDVAKVDTTEVKDSKDENANTAEIAKKIKVVLQETFADKYTMLSNSYIGPTIGNELRWKALTAFIFGLLGITAYITYRFEFAFALGAVLALFHDAIVTLGIYLALGHDLNMTVLAAVLTIVGYSVNDTIVIFDRVREEVFKRKDYELVPLFNECINITLSRTIITSLLTLFAAVSLLVLGGGAIEDLSLFMVIGIVVGAYSTIFIASPIVVAWESFMTRKKRAATA